MTETLIVVAFLVAILGIWQAIQLQAIRRKVDAVPTDANTVAMLRSIDDRAVRNRADVDDMIRRLASLEEHAPHALSRFAVIEFDAFGNITGNQSRSISLLNDRGDGLVITLLTYRDDSVFYTKEVRAGRGVQELSPEEQASVDRALSR
jgi:hypothetical protein